MLRTIVCLVLLGAILAQVQDRTRVEGEAGSGIVEAVVNRIRDSCIFPDFKLFLRRLAYVESNDGEDPKTYRSGYDGGIWQVDKDKFDSIKSSSKATSLFSAINSGFAIDWNRVTWRDLRKPLYSGLAAALYLTTLSEEIPRNMERQGPYYKKHYRGDEDAAHRYYVRVSAMNTVCTQTNLDLAFLVDESSSLGISDFRNAKQFAHNVADKFKIGKNDVRVAFVTFATGYRLQFDFNAHQDKASLLSAIDGISRTEGQTDTDQALTFSADTLFTGSHGARPGASKVILLLTDGDPTDSNGAKAAAARVQSKGIIVFAIGVGAKIQVNRLNEVANEPKCTHVIQLAGYGDLSALVSQIQQVSCKAAAVLGLGEYTFPCSQSGLFRIDSNGQDMLVQLSNTDGRVEIYGSLTNPTPSKTVNSFNIHSMNHVEGRTHPGVVLISKEQKPLYLTIQSHEKPVECTGSYTVKVTNLERVSPKSFTACVIQDDTRICSVVNIFGRLYNLLSPPYAIPSFCQVNSTPAWFPHPVDETKFVFCGFNGTMYVFGCDPHHIYNPSTMLCIPGEPHTTTTTPIPTQPATFQPGNPCTAEHIAQHKFFWPYPPDETKYIDCSNWPTWGYIKSCPPGKIWDQRDTTCTYKHIVINPTKSVYSMLPNPCKNPLRDGDLFYYPHPTDKHKFIQCDQFGDAFQVDCPNLKVWNERLLQCVPENLLQGLLNV